MRIDRLYIRSFLTSAVLACAGLALLFAFVYSTGLLGLGIVCAVVLLLFAFLYGWLRPFGFARRRAEAALTTSGEKVTHLTKEEDATRLKV
ncbi:MAG: hypothetical protein AAB356_05965 [Deltaproteobacteria bacterium]